MNLSMSDDHIDTIGDSGGEGSRNSSSDLTMEHDQDYGRPAPARCPPSNVSELIKAVDGVVVFKPVNLEPLKRCGASPTWCRRKTGGTTTGCEAAAVDPVILVGLIFNFRASPRVWQIELSSLIFGKNVKNTTPTVWQKTWQFLVTWEKSASSA